MSGYFSNEEERDLSIKILEYLLANGKGIDPKTPHMWDACVLHRFDFIDQLVLCGADLDYLLRGTDKDSLLALHRAVKFELPEVSLPIVDYLIQKGVPVDLRDEKGLTPLHSAVCNYTAYRESDHQPQVIEKIIALGADVNASDHYGNTPLHTLANKPNRVSQDYSYQEKERAYLVSSMLKTASILIKHGASINAKNKLGLSPLHDCALKNHLEVTEYLLNNNAEVNAIVDDGKFKGYNPLHLAIYEHKYKMAKLLIQYGADLYYKIPNGNTIYDVVTNENYPDTDMVEYLKPFF